MRMSADKNDVGFSPKAFLASVMLDGVKIDNCVTADEERGEALCYVHPSTSIETELRTGKVVITLPVDKP